MHSPGCSQSQEDGVISWYLFYCDEHACLHKGQPGEDEQSLVGPVVFCCQLAAQKFLDRFPNGGYLDAGESTSKNNVSLLKTSADQVITWLDAGVQAIYFVICKPEAENDLDAAVLTGNQARQALAREIQLDPFISHPILNEIGAGFTADN